MKKRFLEKTSAFILAGIICSTSVPSTLMAEELTDGTESVLEYDNSFSQDDILMDQNENPTVENENTIVENENNVTVGSSDEFSEPEQQGSLLLPEDNDSTELLLPENPENSNEADPDENLDEEITGDEITGEDVESVEADDSPVIKSGTCGEYLNWTLTESGTLRITGQGAMIDWESADDVVWKENSESVSSIIIEKGVTSIGSWAFFDCKNVKSVSIPDSVTRIGEHSFCLCTNMEQITIPNSVQIIENSAFKDCYKLKNVTIPGSVKSVEKYAFENCYDLESIVISEGVRQIGRQAFCRSKSLKSVVLPSGLESIEYGLFWECESLEIVYIPEGVSEIATYVFWKCSALREIQIPEGVYHLGDWSFGYCTSLTSVTLPESLKEIGGNLFWRCKNLRNVNIPQNVERISGAAFMGCESLTVMKLPDTVTWIGENVFRECYNLTYVNIPKNITCIQLGTFWDCRKIKNITIPASVTTIEEYAFAGCNSLTGVFYTGTREQWNRIKIERENWLDTKTIHYRSLQAPVLSVSNDMKGVKVSWKAVSGAKRYRIFYKEAGSEDWIKAGDSTTTSYVKTGLQSGKTYCFTVRCVSEDGIEYISEYNVSGKNIRYIAAPVIKSLKLTTTGIQIAWNSVPGAEKYRVFYKMSGASSWTKAADTKDSGFKINELNSGKTYVFTVRCVNESGTAFTSAHDAAGKTMRYVKAPVITGVSNGTTGATVKWQASPGANHYRVFYKISGTNSWTKAGDVKGTSYTVKGLTSGKTYVFAVRCLNNAGTSFTSNYYTAGKKLTYLDMPKVSVSYAKTGIKTAWTKVAGAEGYYVYRKMSGGNWTKIKTISSSQFSHVDKAVTSGTKYFYTVRAYKGGTMSGFKSDGAQIVAK
ncbi:MAG: fibronectin type III domain-containing protein [Eubacteriales bacterium]|nr:fibronectin type III domain-containing protein [Eubacteriales bacterium]